MSVCKQNGFSLKKTNRKQLRSLSVLAKHESVNVDDCGQPSRFLLVSNAGLICEVSHEELESVFSAFGTIADIVLIPQRPYALIEFSQQLEAIKALEALNQKVCPELSRQLNIAFISQLIWNEVLEKSEQKIETYCSLFDRKPNGLKLVEEFLTLEEEEKVFQSTQSLFEEIPVQQNNRMKNRLVRHFGFEFDYSTNTINGEKPIERIPEEYEFILNRLFERKLIEEIPDQLTVNCYFAGHGIPAHRDTHSMCENCIISVSIGSDIVMQFRNPEDKQQSNVFLPKRSVLLMRDESRYLWTHCISPSKSDLIALKSNKKRLTLSQRKTRISLTFRKVKRNDCKCDFRRYCDSQNPNQEKSEISEENATHLESEYVHKVYETIASHFSETRYKPWPKVSQFLDSLPKGSLVLDVGCGNGKYLNVNSNLVVIGCDRSQQLLNICKQKRNEVFLSDCLQLSVRSAFDACICIAVLHHLSSHRRRVKALQSIVDLLALNGKALVYVWAFEQNKDGTDSQYLKKDQTLADEQREDNEYDLCVHQNGTQFRSQELLVPWKTSADRQLRYYHVFREGELRSLVGCVGNARLLDLYYDSGNWATILQRIQ